MEENNLNHAPPNSPGQIPATPSLFRSVLCNTPGSATAGGRLDQLVPYTPISSVSKLGIGNRQRYVPQIATPQPGLSPWFSCQLVPQRTPVKEETKKSGQETKSNIDIIEEDGVVPNLETATTETSVASSKSSSEEKVERPKKRCKRYLV